MDLTRELETGRSKFLLHPPSWAAWSVRCRIKSWIEGVDYLDELIHGGSTRAASAALHTLGAMMTEPQGCKRAAVFGRVLGLLLTGIAHYDPLIHQTALTVLCRSIFGNPEISQDAAGLPGPHREEAPVPPGGAGQGLSHLLQPRRHAEPSVPPHRLPRRWAGRSSASRSPGLWPSSRHL
ncbi:MAG: hypothetical protein ACLU9S_11720 [Oscillospiraceae bacterium]